MTNYVYIEVNMYFFALSNYLTAWIGPKPSCAITCNAEHTVVSLADLTLDLAYSRVQTDSYLSVRWHFMTKVFYHASFVVSESTCRVVKTQIKIL